MNRNGGISISQANGLYRSLPVQQNVTPTTGQTINVTATSSDINIWLSPAGTLATLTITLPADGVTQVGQTVRIGSSQIITLLTINGATTIFNAPGNLAIGDNFTIEKVAANTWSRMQ